MRSDVLYHLHKYVIIFILHRLDYLQRNARLDPLIELECAPFQSFAILSDLLSQSFNDPRDTIFQNDLRSDLACIDPQFIHSTFPTFRPYTFLDNLLFLFKNSEFIFLKMLPERVAYLLYEHLFSILFLEMWILDLVLFASKGHFSTESRLRNFVCLLLSQNHSQNIIPISIVLPD